MKVFVYGTLLRDEPNHHIMGYAQGKFICEATLKGYSLYNLGSFPAIKEGIGEVKGELYEVEEITPLDALEGVPHLYIREDVIVDTPSGEVNAFAYIYPHRVDNRIDGGDWKSR